MTEAHDVNPAAEGAAEEARRALTWMAATGHGMVMKMVEGVGEEAAFTPLFEGGSNLAWLVAHLVASRDAALELMGAQRVRPAELDDSYDYGSRARSAEEAESFAQHVADYDATHEPLLAALAALTPERLGDASDRRSLLRQVEFRLWHETYHLGQVMLYRRAAGLESTIG